MTEQNKGCFYCGKDCHDEADALFERLDAALAQRDALAEALKVLISDWCLEDHFQIPKPHHPNCPVCKARAALAKVKP